MMFVIVKLVLQLVTYLKFPCFQLAPPLLSASYLLLSAYGLLPGIIMHCLKNEHARCVLLTGNGHLVWTRDSYDFSGDVGRLVNPSCQNQRQGLSSRYPSHPVLTQLYVAQLQCSDGNWCFQPGMTVSTLVDFEMYCELKEVEEKEFDELFLLENFQTSSGMFKWRWVHYPLGGSWNIYSNAQRFRMDIFCQISYLCFLKTDYSKLLYCVT